MYICFRKIESTYLLDNALYYIQLGALSKRDTTLVHAYFSSSFFREAKVQRAVTLCAADEDTQREKKSVKNVANVNFTGVALYSAMYAKKKS